MNNFINLSMKQKRIITTVLMFFIIMSSTQTTVYAHRAYFLQVMIDEGQMLYVGNVIKDNSLKESEKTEPQLWKFEGKLHYGDTDAYKEYDHSNDGKSSMFFTFPAKPFKDLGFLKSNNNATSKDADRAYKIADTLIPNLNELLLIMNDGKKYESAEDLINASHRLLNLYTNKSSITAGKVTISYDGSNYMTVSHGGGDSYKVLVKMKKGYKEPLLENGKKSPLYNSNFNFEEGYYTDEISIASMIVQANYTYIVKGHSAADASEYSKPGTLEIKSTEFLTSIINSLRSLLGLKDISELVYNKGIVGSSMYYKGVMPKSWMESTMKFHMIFQALTWVALSIAIIKLLLKKNFSTVNPAMRVSLIDGIKDLLISGFMLIGVFLIINAMLTVNEKIVNIFATTVPDYSGFTGGNINFESFSGALLQLYYLIISIYLNAIYIFRAMSTGILIASAPVFIASIAFEGKNKNLFESWARELIANIFMQSFHAFILSFVFRTQMSATRGIELAAVSFSLIPMTKFFRSLITGNSGSMIENLGLAGVTMGASAIGNVAGGVIEKGRGTVNRYKGGNDSGNSNIKTKDSSSIPGAGENPNRREHSTNNPKSKNTNETLSTYERDFNATDTNNIDTNYEKFTSKDQDINKANIQNENNNTKVKEKAINKSETLANKPFKNVETFNKNDIGTVVKNTASATKDIVVGGTKVATGAAVGLALGGVGGGKAGEELIKSGTSNLKKGTTTAAITAKDFAEKGINSGYSKLSERYPNKINTGGNILGAEKLDNGDVAIHRDRYILEEEGLQDIRKTSDKNVGITYDKDKLSDENKEYLEKIEKAYTDENFDYLQERGIEKVTKTENGNTVVYYNEHGQNQLGYKDVYKNKNRVVETKAPGQPLESKIIYDIESTTPMPPSGDYSKNKKVSQPVAGNSIHEEHKKRDKMVGMDDLM